MPEAPPDHSAERRRADVVVVGAGIAGLYSALVAAAAGAHVVLVSRSPLAESASYRAQGGIAAALGSGDSPERHLADTLAAGRASSRRSAAEALCEESPARVNELESVGVLFDALASGERALGLEGGHSIRRVAHAGGSATGRTITRALGELVRRHSRIDVLEGWDARTLHVEHGRCAGLSAARAQTRADETSIDLLARAVVLATGGAAALWERTTNPRGAIGAGLTLAHAAGARLADLELVQFHPTALVAPKGGDGFLITEALRGEGALLLDHSGERFVDELAPRDEVALAIEARLGGRTGGVDLDMRSLDLEHFPNVAAALGDAGLDPARDLVPVAPAAHYTMGGIATDLDGRSSLPGLYAVGECACTGLHGANRLASNSLAECLVFGRRAAEGALAEPAPAATALGAPADTPAHAPSRSSRRALWRLAGLTRSEEGLRELAQDGFALARLIARSALARTESRGAHQRSDLPATDPALDGMHVVIAGEEPAVLEHWV